MTAGRNAGDMPNIMMPSSGIQEIQVLNTRINLDRNLFDADGAPSLFTLVRTITNRTLLVLPVRA